MGRPDTATVEAGLADESARRNRSVVQFVGYAVSPDFFAITGEIPKTSPIDCADPVPALMGFRSINLRPESLCQRKPHSAIVELHLPRGSGNRKEHWRVAGDQGSRWPRPVSHSDGRSAGPVVEGANQLEVCPGIGIAFPNALCLSTRSQVGQYAGPLSSTAFGFWRFLFRHCACLSALR